MRSFELTIGPEVFSRGLNPSKAVSRTHPTALQNVVPVKGGLEPLRIWIPGISGEPIAIPSNPYSDWAQVIRISRQGHDIVGFDSWIWLREITRSQGQPYLLSGLFSVYNVTAPNTPIEVAGSLGVGLNAQPNGQWQLVDLMDSWYLFNRRANVTFFQTGYSELNNETRKVFFSYTPTIRAGALFKGRVVIGGFDRTNFWNTTWQTVFTTWQAAMPAGIFTSFDDLDFNWVAWGSIGGGDFPAWLMQQNSTFTEQDDVTAGNILERVRRNEFGFMPVPVGGTVIRLIPLGEHLIAYTTEGVVALRTVEAEGMFTFGVRRIARMELMAAGGDDQGHLFLDSRGDLFSLSPDLRLEMLGHRRTFGSAITGANSPWTIHKDEFTGHYFIQSQVIAAILTPSGLCTHFRQPTSLYGTLDPSYSYLGLWGELSIKYPQVITPILDMGNNGIKTITQIQLEGDFPTGEEPQVDIYTSYVKGATPVSTGLVSLNKELAVRKPVSGVDFLIEVRGNATEEGRQGFGLHSIRIEYQFSDKRYARGVNVSQALARGS